jgi:hypothetical protein
MDERDSSSSREIVSGGNGPSDSNRSRFAGGVMVAALGWANTAIAQDISADPQGSGGRARSHSCGRQTASAQESQLKASPNTALRSLRYDCGIVFDYAVPDDAGYLGVED